jgi:ADP-heptose:LPS heptosyltransferase
VRLYSLQKGDGAKQANALPPGMNLVRLDKELDSDAPFVDTAAVMANLDLIVTIDTSIAHLAGALGRPVWTLLCTMPDWRWLLDRSDSPWYPGMRLFRQRVAGDWQPVFGQVAKTLNGMVRDL